MSNGVPEIPGYQLDQRILQHPFAELWHGRNFTGMEVVALVLSESGARDATVRERLARASRVAALEPGQLETPLWAANLTAPSPYAITQLIPGLTGAERLIDPLDGILGNDDDSLRAVRAQLSQYGAMPPTLAPTDDTPLPPGSSEGTAIPSYTEHPAETQPNPTGVAPQSKIAVAREYRRRIGGWIYLVAAFVVLLVFTVTYSIGAAVGSAVKPEETTQTAPAEAVSPGAYPSPVLLPAIHRITTAPYKRPDDSTGVFGATYAAGADVQVVSNAELPFAVGWPRPPQVDFLGESSSLVLRRLLTKSEYSSGGVKSSFKADIALHPCVSLARCLADRPSFDRQWTKLFEAPAPVTAKDSRTWIATANSPYVVTMTHAFLSGGQWWLVGTAVGGGQPGEEADVQRVVNDIWRQTS